MTLPTSYGWVLASDPLPPAPSVVAGPLQPGQGPDVNPRYFTQAFFLEMYERVLDEAYMDGLREQDGYELLRAFGLGLERVSLAVGLLECGLLIGMARGAHKAVGIVEFHRPTASAGAFTVLTGSVLSTSRCDRRFITLEDAVFGVGEVGPKAVRVEAITFGYEYNVRGQFVSPTGDVMPGEIDSIILNYQEPAFTDQTVFVKQIIATTGGSFPFLDLLGDERGIERQPGEDDDSYRARISALPDTVAPGAFRRLAALLFARYGLELEVIETWQPDYVTCWDCPSPNPGTPTYTANIPPSFDTNNFVYDDPRPSYPFINRWLDENDYRGSLFIVTPKLVKTISDYGFAFDDPGVTMPDFKVQLGTATGERAVGALDLPNVEGITGGCYDGEDYGLSSILSGLLAVMQEIKLGGNYVTIERQFDYP